MRWILEQNPKRKTSVQIQQSQKVEPAKLRMGLHFFEWKYVEYMFALQKLT